MAGRGSALGALCALFLALLLALASRAVDARDLPVSSERELQSLTQGGIAYSQQAVLQTPIMCRLHARYPELATFVEVDLPNHQRVEWRPIGGDPRLFFFQDGNYRQFYLANSSRAELLQLLADNGL